MVDLFSVRFSVYLPSCESMGMSYASHLHKIVLIILLCQLHIVQPVSMIKGRCNMQSRSATCVCLTHCSLVIPYRVLLLMHIDASRLSEFSTFRLRNKYNCPLPIKYSQNERWLVTLHDEMEIQSNEFGELFYKHILIPIWICSNMIERKRLEVK